MSDPIALAAVVLVFSTIAGSIFALAWVFFHYRIAGQMASICAGVDLLILSAILVWAATLLWSYV